VPWRQQKALFEEQSVAQQTLSCDGDVFFPIMCTFIWQYVMYNAVYGKFKEIQENKEYAKVLRKVLGEHFFNEVSHLCYINISMMLPLL
jgi:hypothetical protein